MPNNSLRAFYSGGGGGGGRYALQCSSSSRHSRSHDFGIGHLDGFGGGATGREGAVAATTAKKAVMAASEWAPKETGGAALLVRPFYVVQRRTDCLLELVVRARSFGCRRRRRKRQYTSRRRRARPSGEHWRPPRHRRRRLRPSVTAHSRHAGKLSVFELAEIECRDSECRW